MLARITKKTDVTMGKVFRLAGIFLVLCLLALPLVGCSGLSLTVRAPRDGANFTAPSVTVQGNVSNPRATITVNDVRVPVSRKTGYFNTTVTLTEGENIIKVVATRGKETVTKTLTVTYTPSDESKVKAQIEDRQAVQILR